MRRAALLLAAALSAAGALAQDAQDAPDAPRVSRPRLVVLVEVDALIPEQLERLDPWLTGGLRRALDAGAVFVEAELPYGTTDSAPGVATLATGRLPREHGVVSDAPWFRDERRQRLCVADAATRTVSSYDWVVAEGASASSAVLVGDGFAELLRAAAPGAKSVVLGAKGLDVALLGGRAPDLAAWWDPYGRGFVSSTAFVDALPAWLAAWNARWFEPVRDWSWTSTLPAAPAELAAAADERAGEEPLGGAPPRLPFPAPELPATLAPVHQAHLAARAFASPLVDRLCVDAALAALDGEGLGVDDVPDLLALALGGGDLVVRATGPYSVETTDTLLRLDRELGRLFDALDARLGRDGWLGVVASDRGVLELPEGAPLAREGAVRLPVRARREAQQAVRDALEGACGEDFGATFDFAARELYLPGLADDDPRAPRARAAAARAVAAQPWVASAWTRERLLAAPAPEDGPWIALARASYFPARGADVVVRPAHRHLMARPEGTAWGSPYRYDRRETLVLLGPDVPGGRRRGPASALDVLPTVFERLHLPLPEGVTGRALLGE